MKLRHLSVLSLLLLVGCPEEEEEGPTYAENRLVDVPDVYHARGAAIVMRITNSATTQSDVHRGMTNIFNNNLDVGDLLMRGGLPRDPDGAPLPLGSGSDTSSVADQHGELLGASSPEQVRAYYERRVIDQQLLFDQGESTDACGNPMIAAFVTPDILQEAAVGDPTADPVWPDACAGPDCNDLQVGVVDVALTEQRFDGMVDMLVTIFPDVSTNPPTPALWGHMLGYFLSSNNPGFEKIPMLLNTRQFQVSVLNLWQLQKAYLDPQGLREVYAFPHTARDLASTELIVSMEGLPADSCKEAYSGSYEGPTPFGCEQQTALTLDQNGELGQTIFSQFTKDGTDPFNIDQLVRIFKYQLATAAVCPTVSGSAWVQDGPVEFFLCPEELGGINECIAAQDMEEFSCRPEAEAETYLSPERQQVPLTLTEQREPFLIAPPGADPYGYTTPDPFVGQYVDLELTVTAHSVLYMYEANRITEIRDADGELVLLPEALANSHCDSDGLARYNLGETWAPGTYTVRVPWNNAAAELFMNFTSVPSWVN